ncbi:4Fe-4S dicluster domain-containing protein [Desulfococcaceae bacterium HSG9]|nr:4Fe-4S dicluster domain-containing protein [Desulfococcaceae bacterium HSG9]
MITVRLKKGCKLNIAGKPALETEVLAKPSHVALVPERIPFIKPRLKVRVGDRVKIGSPVFEDKRNPEIKFLSPGGGEIDVINFGPRRVIREIVIRVDKKEESVRFKPLTDQELETTQRDDLVRAMTDGGIWPFIKSFPFRDITDPQGRAPGIFINLGDSEPFQPRPEVYLQGAAELFEFGVRILRKLVEKVYVARRPGDSSIINSLNHLITHTCHGDYPVDDPGVMLYHSKKSSEENGSWYIDGQDVLHLARFFKTGLYPIERIMVLAGSQAHESKHFQTRAGVPLTELAQWHKYKTSGVRFVAGGLFRGYTGAKNSYMGFYENSLTLITQGDNEEAFGFIRPGYGKPSSSKTFLSCFNTSELALNCGLHGELRACINCGYCAQVCPVDILPQFTYKSVIADEIEESLAHGLLDCAECGLCTYVCPSKIELCARFKQAKAAYYKELV